MQLEREHIYLIPPGAYLSIQSSALRLSQPRERHGAPPAVRLFPALVGGRARRTRDLRDPLGNRRRRQPGLKAVKEPGGLVIAQDLEDPKYKQASCHHHELAHMKLSRTVPPPPLSARYLGR
jgi:two-component system, chemotaxis family, CheB/CheR fusion protein